MTKTRINRRIHLFLALFLLPWFVMYGLSSIAFSHGTYFEELDKAKNLPLWKTVAEKSNYEMPATDDLKVFANRIVRETGLPLDSSFGAYRQSPTQINVYVYNFWKSSQVKCFLDQKRILVEDRRFRWDQFLTGMHANGGFDQPGLHHLWSIVIDLVCLGMLLWVATGLVMWWHLPQTRRWGWMALLSGIASFAIFLSKL